MQGNIERLAQTLTQYNNQLKQLKEDAQEAAPAEIGAFEAAKAVRRMIISILMYITLNSCPSR